MSNDIYLTESAIQYIKEYLKLSDDNQSVRLKLKKSGCSGLSYDLQLLDTFMPDMDQALNISGLQLVISHADLQYVKGTEIDCVRDGLNTNLVFNNPNAIGSCGCGESFTVEKSE